MTLLDYLTHEGLSQQDFASRVGLSPAYVSRLVSGEKRPSWTVVERIHHATGGTVSANDWMSSAETAA